MSAFLRKYGVALDLATAGSLKIRLPIRKAGSTDFATGADWTPAAGDVKVSKDGGAQANIATLPSYSNGSWEFTLSAAELEVMGAEVRIVDSATKAIEDAAFNVETFGHADAMYPPDHADTVDLGLSAFDALLSAISGLIASGIPISVGSGVSSTGLLTIIRGDTLTAVLTLPEGSLSDADEAWVTVKRTRDDVDSQCVIQWKKTTGLVFVQGTAAGGAFTGAFTQDTDEQITVTASAAAAALITPRGNLVYDVQKKNAGGTVTTIVEGTARVLADITRATS